MSRLGIAFFMVASVACDPATLKHTPDAAKQIDGAPDAPKHGQVTITFYDPNTPGSLLAGVPIVFIEADGTVVGAPMTDSLGIVHADVHANATATAVLAPTAAGNDEIMMTVAGIQPGDNIVLGPSKDTTSTTIGTFTISWPTNASATSYNIVTPCTNVNAGSATSYVMTMYSYCQESAMDLMVVANNASNQPIGYIEKPNVAFMPSGSTFISGSYLLPGTFNASFTNVDASIPTISFSRQTPAGYTGYFTSPAPAAPNNGTVSLSGLAFNAQTAHITVRTNKPNYINQVLENQAGNATSYSLDVGNTLLPFVGPATADFANNKIAVMVDTTGTSHDKPDLFLAEFTYTRNNGSAGTQGYEWIVFGPEPGDFVFPPLPSQLSDVVPKGTDTFGNAFVLMIESTATTWDMIRAAPYDYVFTGNPFSAADTTTKIRESAYQPRGG